MGTLASGYPLTNGAQTVKCAPMYRKCTRQNYSSCKQ